jgi:hypothetical protein
MNQAMAPIPAGALARLRQAAAIEQAVEPWRPDSEPTLEGEIAGGRDADNAYGQRQRQMLVRTPDGRLVAIWLSQWLARELKAREAQPGDLVSLTMAGKATSKRGTVFNKLALVVLKRECIAEVSNSNG